MHMRLGGNIEWKEHLASKEPVPPEEQSIKNGTLSFSSVFQGNKAKLELFAAGTYTGGLNPKSSLSSVKMCLVSDHHTFEVGDVSFQAPDLALYSSGRRGVRYKLSLKNFEASAFLLSTQQLSGLGLPSSNSNMRGGTIKLKLGSLVLRSLFLTGKDDPSLGVNQANLISTVRKGSIFSFGGSLNLHNKLKVEGDYFLSSYDNDISDKEKAKRDSAIVIRGSFNNNIINLSGEWRRIGLNYNSVGTTMISNNQTSFVGNMALSFSKLLISSSVNYLKSNIASVRNIPESQNLTFDTIQGQLLSV